MKIALPVGASTFEELFAGAFAPDGEHFTFSPKAIARGEQQQFESLDQPENPSIGLTTDHA